MIRLLALLIVLVGVSAEAYFAAASYGVRYERGIEDSVLATRQPYGFLLGHRIKMFSVVGEYATFSESTGNPTLTIHRRQHMGLLGVRYHVLDPDDLFTWYPYVSGGVGAYKDIVTTDFMGSSVSQESVWRPVFTMGVGFFGEVITHVRVGAEIRALNSKDFDPSTLLDLGLRLGYQFN